MKKSDFNKLSKKEQLNAYLEGEAWYSHVQTPKAGYGDRGTPLWVVSLHLTDPAMLKKASELGLKIVTEPKVTRNGKVSDIPCPYVEIKRNIRPPRTVEDTRPEVVDSMQKPIPRSVLVGNGSKVIVKFGRYWYEENGGGVGTTLFKVQVLDLVPFERNDGFVTKEDGYIAPASSGKAPIQQREVEDQEFDDEIPF